MPIDFDNDPEGQPETTAVSTLPNIFSILPMPQIDLTPSEQQEVERYQFGRTLFGAVAQAPMTCPPTPNLPPDADGLSVLAMLAKQNCCPYARACPLLKKGKAPHGEQCPLETAYVVDRFVSWAKELGGDPYQLTETDRVAASELTSIDLTENRCLSILGEAESARLTDLSVKETAQNGDPLSYEKVIHINQQALEGARNRRRTILHDYELTPEMKTKKAKYATGEKGADLSVLQSARADKFKDYQQKKSKPVPTTAMP